MYTDRVNDTYPSFGRFYGTLRGESPRITFMMPTANLTKDNNKNITQTSSYKYLNLPTLITVTGKGTRLHILMMQQAI
jgi:hypothetical protein